MQKCPKCGSTKFFAKACVTQDWIIDGNGNFIQLFCNCSTVIHKPSKKDAWTCTECGHVLRQK